jgi:hypothetical protein
MKIVAVICNVVLFAFTCMVLLTDGLPTQAAYIVFTVWLLLTLIVNVVVISRIGANDGRLWLQMPRTTASEQGEAGGRRSTSAFVRVAVALCNVVLLGFTGWAFVDQYPHPEEDGFVAFIVLMVLTPILSLAALVRGGAGAGQPRPHLPGQA